MSHRGSLYSLLILNAAYTTETMEDELTLESTADEFASNLIHTLSEQAVNWKYRFNADPAALHTELMFYEMFLKMEAQFGHSLKIMHRYD